MDATEKSNPGSQERQKQAACLECRKSKIRCMRTDDNVKCRKCEASGLDCIVPAYHVGRYKGVKNKRTGLEKAISQIEQAIKRSRTVEPTADDQQARALEQLLQETTATIEKSYITQQPGAAINSNSQSSLVEDQNSEDRRHVTRSVSFVARPASGDVTVDSADNPLELLAIASTIPSAILASATPSTIGHTPGGGNNGNLFESETQAFFKPLKSKLDLSPDFDPITLGLVTESDADRLFKFFHENLAHTRWGLDVTIHNAAFVRSRSAFLFTSVMAASALFLSDTAALSKRLRNHVKRLVQSIFAERYRSVEIVLAFMINVPWMAPGDSWAADDETCYYISMALTIALDLSLNRIVLPSSTLRPPGYIERLTKSDSITAEKALSLDGIENVASSSELGKRLLRTRERVWLALYNLDRGVCLARGRPPTVPASPLVETCDTWHICDTYEKQDGALVSSTVLRRDFTALVGSIQTTCDQNQLTVRNGSTVIKLMRDKIETFFEHWFETWKIQIRQPDGKIPPYVEILASHTKLSAYCNVINHPTAPTEVRQFFRVAGLASALNVIRTAVQAETRLRSMPNNTVIMVSFAACFVLGLDNDAYTRSSHASVNARVLIEEVAGVLERIGSTPTHRNGASAKFGKHIKAIVQRSATNEFQTAIHTHASFTKESSSDVQSNDVDVRNIDRHPSMINNQEVMEENSVPFSGYPIFNMTDDEIIETITRTRHQPDTHDINFQPPYDETQFLDWLDLWG